jgi:hypothetical protein
MGRNFGFGGKPEAELDAGDSFAILVLVLTVVLLCALGIAIA